MNKPLASLVAAAAVLLCGPLQAEKDPGGVSEIRAALTPAGADQACAAESKAAYLSCFQEQRCSAHPLPEHHREKCDACWQSYQETTQSCKPLNAKGNPKEKVRESESQR